MGIPPVCRYGPQADLPPFTALPFGKPGIGFGITIHQGQYHPIGERQGLLIHLTAPDEHDFFAPGDTNRLIE
jgi:hypothetical protein